MGIDEIALKKGQKDFVTIVTMRVGNTHRYGLKESTAGFDDLTS